MGVDVRDGAVKPLPELARDYKARGHRVVRGRRRELRRGLVARARGDGAALHGRAGGPRALVRPHPRGEPEEAGRAAAHVRGPGRLRQGPRRRHRRPRRPRGARARQPGHGRLCTTPTAAPTSSRRTTRCPTSTSSGSRPAPPSTCSPPATNRNCTLSCTTLVSGSCSHGACSRATVARVYGGSAVSGELGGEVEALGHGFVLEGAPVFAGDRPHHFELDAVGVLARTATCSRRGRSRRRARPAAARRSRIAARSWIVSTCHARW